MGWESMTSPLTYHWSGGHATGHHTTRHGTEVRIGALAAELGAPLAAHTQSICHQIAITLGLAGPKVDLREVVRLAQQSLVGSSLGFDHSESW
jgi:hypothetical protein